MRKVLLFFTLFAFAFSFEMKELEKELKAKYIDGNFTQIKSMKNFPMPFKSSGNFKIVDSKELIWKTIKPIENQIKIDENGIFTLDENQKWQKTNNSMDKGLFLDLLSMNEDSIKEVFNINLRGNKKSWTLVLKPKNYLLKEIFNSIKINGSDTIKSFDINETRGDFSHIDFFNTKKIDEQK